MCLKTINHSLIYYSLASLEIVISSCTWPWLTVSPDNVLESEIAVAIIVAYHRHSEMVQAKQCHGKRRQLNATLESRFFTL